MQAASEFAKTKTLAQQRQFLPVYTLTLFPNPKAAHRAQAASEFAKTKTLAQQRQFLPVYTVRDELLQVIRENQVVVVVGETGSGKTTQVRLAGHTLFGHPREPGAGGGRRHRVRQDHACAAHQGLPYLAKSSANSAKSGSICRDARESAEAP